MRVIYLTESSKNQVSKFSTALGAVLLQQNHPAAYVTKALSKSQIYCPHIEKEALAIRFDVKISPIHLWQDPSNRNWSPTVGVNIYEKLTSSTIADTENNV